MISNSANRQMHSSAQRFSIRDCEAKESRLTFQIQQKYEECLLFGMQLDRHIQPGRVVSSQLSSQFLPSGDWSVINSISNGPSLAARRIC